MTLQHNVTLLYKQLSTTLQQASEFVAHSGAVRFLTPPVDEQRQWLARLVAFFGSSEVRLDVVLKYMVSVAVMQANAKRSKACLLQGLQAGVGSGLGEKELQERGKNLSFEAYLQYLYDAPFHGLEELHQLCDHLGRKTQPKPERRTGLQRNWEWLVRHGGSCYPLVEDARL